MTKVNKFIGYITKYALTQGIQKQVLCCTGIDGLVEEVGAQRLTSYYHGGEWHKSLDLAIEHAEKMRTNKINSLQRQIDKLRELKFTERKNNV